MDSTPALNKDTTFVLDLIAKEIKRQQSVIELIASENYTSPAIREALGSVLTHKYAEGLPGKRYYEGCEIVDEIEQLAINRAKFLFGAAWANVQPHSGSQANAAVMLAVLQPGDKILGFDLAHGGHLTHGSPVNFSGKLYQAAFYGVEPDTGTIDFDRVAEKILQEKPKLVICGASAYSRDWDYAILRAAADQVGAFLLADIAHTAGFIACGLLNNPFLHCHFITTTTHKTLRGPRGGMILMGQDFPNPLGIRNKKGVLRPMSQLLDSAVFPGTQGGPQLHAIASKAICFGEAMQPVYKTYMLQVRKNAQAMAKTFMDAGHQVVSRGTDNHLFLLDFSERGFTGKQVAKWLTSVGISVNKNAVPFDSRPPRLTSGIRIGTPAITTRGFVEADCVLLAERMVELLEAPEEISVQTRVAQACSQWIARKPKLYAW